jgi:regulator of replication initiation timing
VFNKIKKLLTNKTYTYNDIRSIVWSLEEFIDENLFFKAETIVLTENLQK